MVSKQEYDKIYYQKNKERKYQQFLKKKEDPVWAEQYRLRTLELQRKRANGEIKRRQQIAQKVWKERKALGIKERKPHSPHLSTKIVFPDRDFLVTFD